VNLTKYIGIPYKPKGRSMMGVDCMGLVYLFYRDALGMEIPSYAVDYSSSEDRVSVAGAIMDNLPNWRKVSKPMFGDLLVFNILGLPVHVGVYLGNGDFLHGFMRTQSCIERLDSITWDRRLNGVFRWVKS